MNNRCWVPKSGDLVRFYPTKYGIRPPTRVAKVTFERFKKVIIPPEWIFIVLGELDFETKLKAVYADEQQASSEPDGFDTYTPYLWCLAGQNGVYIIKQTLLMPV